MKKTLTLLLAGLFFYVQSGLAQQAREHPNLWMFAVEGGPAVPAGDLSDRFGMLGKVGPSLLYRFHNNLYMGLAADFLFNSNVKEDSLLKDIMTPDGRIIGADGFLYLPELQMRGWQITFWVGKLFESSSKSGSGILTMLGAGILQHRINYYLSESGTVPQISGEYLKGYDRLSNGFSLSEYVGYHYLSSNHLVNFNIGLDMSQALTRNRRVYDYAGNRSDEGLRIDLLFALKASWILPFYKRPEIKFPNEPSLR